MTDRSTRRRVLRTAATAVSGLVLLAGAGGVVVIGGQSPTEPEPVAASGVDVSATTTTLVCPGPPRLATAAAGEDLGYDEFDPEGSGTETLLGALTLADDATAPGPASLTPLDGEDGLDLERAGSGRLTTLDDVGETRVLRADPVSGVNALAAGSSLSVTGAGDLRGLTATDCQAPGAGAWLVGGSTEPGASSQLVLSNPGDTPATVTVRAWGATGELDTSLAGNVLVPPQGQQVVLLEAVVAGEPRLALQLEVAGGEVAATLQDSRLRGLVPAGTDLVRPGTSPAQDLLIPGVVLTETAAEDADADGETSAIEEPLVRLVNPGEDETRVRVDLLGEDGVTEVPGAGDLVLDPGVTTDVSLAGLPAGEWSVRISAESPVAAAAMLASVGQAAEEDPDTPPVDRAWVPTTAPLTSGLVAVPGLAELAGPARLVLGNTATEPVDLLVTAVLADGERAEPRSVTVPAESGAALDLAELAEGTPVALQVQTEDERAVHAAVHLLGETADGRLVTMLPVPPDTQAVGTVPLAPVPSTLR